MRTALITGANRGIGLAVAQSLAANGHRVIMGCRSPKEGEDAAAEISAKGAQGWAAPSLTPISRVLRPNSAA